jgi:hypothetical protein
MKIEGLKKLVDENCRGDNWGIAEICQKPWQINFSGIEYTLASDGKAMIILKNTTNEFLPLSAAYCARVLPHLQFPVGGQKMSIELLKRWAGPPIWSNSEPCDECKGSGISCEGGYHCEDDEDFHETQQKCEDCSGSGKVVAMPLRLGRVGKLYFNLNLVAGVLETATTEDVLVEVDECRLIINGEGWRAWIMGLSQSFKPEKEPMVPVLTIPTAT